MTRAVVAVVPRERLSATPATLESVLANTPRDVDIVCVDARSPERVRRAINQVADDRVRVIRSDRWLSPNQARNLAATALGDAEYIVFVDNDVLVRPGWFEALVACADETDAWVVGPLTLKGEWETATVHMAGGDLWWEDGPGGRRLHETHRHAGRRVDDVAGELQRTRTDLAEFHCALVRRSVFEKLGPLDEELLSTREQVDLCLSVAAAGGEVWFEPASVVTYVPPPPIALRDLPYFWLRWSEQWTDASVERFAAKHGGTVSDGHVGWLRKHRFLPLQLPLSRMVGAGAAEGARIRVLTPVETVANRVLVRLWSTRS